MKISESTAEKTIIEKTLIEGEKTLTEGEQDVEL